MTLQDTILAIEKVAANQPDVHMIVENDIFRLNSYADAKYGVFAWTQGQHTASATSGLISYTFTFFYVDRLTADKSNQIEVQSVGIQTLDNIIKHLYALEMYAGSYTFQTFNQRFLDECAGVFTNVTLEVPAGSTCPDTFADFNDDFNEDFLIV